ncbi:38701_t:CDS:2, partial [Gigaspora margarita]
LTRDIRVTDPLDNHDKIWRGNLACNIIEKEIFYLDQLLNNNNSELITWQQLKKAWSESAKGKKARWFAEIERQTLVNNTSRLVKDKFRLDKKIQQTSKSWMLGRIEKKKERKLSVEHWVERKVNNGKKFVKLPSEHKLIDSIEIAEMEIELINGLNMEKETKDMLS